MMTEQLSRKMKHKISHSTCKLNGHNLIMLMHFLLIFLLFFNNLLASDAGHRPSLEFSKLFDFEPTGTHMFQPLLCCHVTSILVVLLHFVYADDTHIYYTFEP